MKEPFPIRILEKSSSFKNLTKCVDKQVFLKAFLPKVQGLLHQERMKFLCYLF